MRLVDRIAVWHRSAVYYRFKGGKASETCDSFMAADYHSASNAYFTAARELAEDIGVDYDVITAGMAWPESSEAITK